MINYRLNFLNHYVVLRSTLFPYLQPCVSITILQLCSSVELQYRLGFPGYRDLDYMYWLIECKVFLHSLAINPTRGQINLEVCLERIIKTIVQLELLDVPFQLALYMYHIHHQQVTDHPLDQLRLNHRAPIQQTWLGSCCRLGDWLCDRHELAADHAFIYVVWMELLESGTIAGGHWAGRSLGHPRLESEKSQVEGRNGWSDNCLSLNTWQWTVVTIADWLFDIFKSNHILQRHICCIEASTEQWLFVLNNLIKRCSHWFNLWLFVLTNLIKRCNLRMIIQLTLWYNEQSSNSSDHTTKSFINCR